jgi:hypothetical protein
MAMKPTLSNPSENVASVRVNPPDLPGRRAWENLFIFPKSGRWIGFSRRC